MSKEEKATTEVISIKITRELKMKLKKEADKQHRTIQGQTLFFVEKGLSHPADAQAEFNCAQAV